MRSPHLKKLDFELAYLALLTQAEVKPLSRWEKSLIRRETKILKRLGLKTAVVQRTVRSGKSIEEIVFSTSEDNIDEYLTHFDQTPINRSPQTRRIEGALFGYPSCCVEHFIEKGYAPNDLLPEAQRILFHWACTGCSVTPLLLPRYWEVYQHCRELFDRVDVSQYDSMQRSYFRKSIAVAASLALLTSGSEILFPKATAQDSGHKKEMPVSLVSNVSPDPHLIPLAPQTDADQDYLTDDEELHVGSYPDSSDTDGDGVLDGVQLAKELSAIIQDLPAETNDTEPYRIDHMTFGLETCEKCGETVNMGFVEIINPHLHISVEIPSIGLHFMEYGGFSYAGDVHTGRVNVPLLNAVLKSGRDPHWLAVEGDTDHDGLADDEEISFGTNLQNADTDDDGVYDGVELAVHMRTVIDGLPRSESTAETYLTEHPQWGLEVCDMCGETVNMGYVEIINPLEGLSVDIPYIGLHYMEHGSFAYAGDIHEGRANVKLLHTILESNGTAHLIPIDDDSDGDGLTDKEEIHFGSDPGNPNSNLDGVGLAKAMWSAISALDTVENEIEPYIVEHEMRGVVSCPVCGICVNMGYVEIVGIPQDLRLEIPYLGLHFMEHGSFAYGCGQDERIDPIQTASILRLPLKGDINRDGKIDITDVLSFVNFILGSVEPTPDQFWAADLNGDGNLDILDVVGIVNVILGIGECSPVAVKPIVNDAVLEFLNSLESFLPREDYHRFMKMVKDVWMVPTEYSLKQNYPNPFNPETRISYTLPEAARVRIGVYNTLGQEVDVLVQAHQDAGYYEVVWDGGGVASGVYFYQIVANEFTSTKRMILMK